LLGSSFFPNGNFQIWLSVATFQAQNGCGELPIRSKKPPGHWDTDNIFKKNLSASSIDETAMLKGLSSKNYT
jgi:hypothetical protein